MDERVVVKSCEWLSKEEEGGVRLILRNESRKSLWASRDRLLTYLYAGGAALKGVLAHRRIIHAPPETLQKKGWQWCFPEWAGVCRMWQDQNTQCMNERILLVSPEADLKIMRLTKTSL
jgi:hypothetical protein